MKLKLRILLAVVAGALAASIGGQSIAQQAVNKPETEDKIERIEVTESLVLSPDLVDFLVRSAGRGSQAVSVGINPASQAQGIVNSTIRTKSEGHIDCGWVIVGWNGPFPVLGVECTWHSTAN